MLNIKILNIANNLQKNNIKNPSVSLADIADNMMSCDICDSYDIRDIRDIRDSCDIRKENDVSHKNIYTIGTDGTENDKAILLENNRLGEKKEWTEIRIAK